MERELVVQCNLYLKMQENETKNDAIERLIESIICNDHIEYQIFNSEIRET